MPNTFFSPCAMPPLSFTGDSTTDKEIFRSGMQQQTQTGTELHDIATLDNGTASDSGSIVIDRRHASRHRRSRSMHSIQDFGPSIPSLASLSANKSSRSSSELSDSTSTIPTVSPPDVTWSQPPMESKISFGSVSRFSYYADFPSRALLEAKSMGAAVIEDLADQQVEERQSAGCLCMFCITAFVCGLNLTSLTTCLTTIAVDLSLSSDQAIWVIISWLLSAALPQPLVMRLSPAVPSKRLLSSAFLLLLGGSIATALASDIVVLMAGRSLSGVGCGTAVVLIQLIVKQHIAGDQPKVRERTVSLFLWLGIAVGPLIGAVVTSSSTWRYVPWINIPFCVIGLVAGAFFLRLPASNTPACELLSRIDYTGWTLLVGGLIPLCFALTSAGITQPWSSWPILFAISISLVTLVIWSVHTRIHTDSILPVSIFGKSRACMACMGTLAHGTIFAVVLVFLPVFCLRVAQLDLQASGVALLPCSLAIFLAAAITSMFTPSTCYPGLTSIGWLITTMGISLLIWCGGDTTSISWVSCAAVLGTGVGILTPSLNSAIQNSATTDDETIHATSLHSFLSTLGQALGVVFGTAVFPNRFSALSAAQDLNPLDAQIKLKSLLFSSPRVENEPIAVLYAESLQWVWIAASILSGLALISNLLLLFSTKSTIPLSKPWTTVSRGRGLVWYNSGVQS